jgi:DeoR/GlpR family transcriptional regulator of sugar metabolism
MRRALPERAGSESADSHALSADARRAAIQDLLRERNEVTVNDLVERFDVSVMTVHRDLDTLEHRGVLRKVRGGATAQPSSFYENALAFRMEESTAAKEAIGEAAARLVGPGSSIVLDDSTTALAMLPHLVNNPQLTIVTNFLSVLDTVRAMTDDTIEVIFVGGLYKSKYGSVGGALTVNSLKEFRVDQCFLSVSAVNVALGAFHREADHAELKRAMIGIAEDSILLVDSTKFTKRAMHRIVDFDAFARVIVDAATPPEVIDGLRARSVAVEVAGRRSSAAHG